jgi:L-threonylcarbamoyladenylate synthase
MEVLTKTEFLMRKEEIINKIKKGTIFIHPSDTIYGLSCNALDEKAVDKIRKLKDRPETPFSVWVPSLEWIKQNCSLNKEGEEWLKKLPGPYTLIIKLKNKKSVAKNVSPNNISLGLRMPQHWFNDLVKFLGFPIITTSANKAGLPYMTSLKDLDSEISKGVDFIIYEGEKVSRPSKIINLVKKEIMDR